jgi:DNA repair protein RadC
MSNTSQPLAPALYVLESRRIYRQATADEIMDAALNILGERLPGSEPLNSPRIVRDYLRVKLGRLEHEVFGALLLDAQHRLIAYAELFRGTVTQTAVYPREVVKEALRRNAAAVILVHNHPSGVSEPSRADEQLTQTLKSALEIVDVRVLDHLIIAGNQIASFAESGLL